MSGASADEIARIASQFGAGLAKEVLLQQLQASIKVRGLWGRALGGPGGSVRPGFTVTSRSLPSLSAELGPPASVGDRGSVRVAHGGRE